MIFEIKQVNVTNDIFLIVFLKPLLRLLDAALVHRRHRGSGQRLLWRNARREEACDTLHWSFTRVLFGIRTCSADWRINI